MSTVLITGCSSGFGLETARLFLEQGWNVVATMRTPRPETLPVSDQLRILALEVTSAESIARAVAEAGPIDVLVNNAGFGVLSPLELVTADTAHALFETNTLGTLAMTQAVLPQFRQRRSGVVINISSAVTLKPLPLVGVYRASKAAVNAFTESLAPEVQPFNIRVHLVLPGRSPETNFGASARPYLRGLDDPDYSPLLEQVVAGLQDTTTPVTQAKDVARAIWRAATQPDTPLHIPAGVDAQAWMAEVR